MHWKVVNWAIEIVYKEDKGKQKSFYLHTNLNFFFKTQAASVQPNPMPSYRCNLEDDICPFLFSAQLPPVSVIVAAIINIWAELLDSIHWVKQSDKIQYFLCEHVWPNN